MFPGYLIRLRPTTPWRIGPDSGAKDRVDAIFHSDSLYAAVTSAMDRLGCLEEWLDATARADQPAVRFSSCFPFQDEVLYITPPRNLWPPTVSAKVRWKGARFVPLNLVRNLLDQDTVREEGWAVDGISECLVPVGRSRQQGPFRVAVRHSAAVDRATHAWVEPHATGCIEFAENSGFWFLVAFAGDAAKENWDGRIKAALRLLADSGYGGERARGWGRSEMPSFTAGRVPDLLLSKNGEPKGRPKAPPPAVMETPENGLPVSADEITTAIEDVEPAPAPVPETAYWLLSLYTPGNGEAIDWRRGAYSILSRGGRVESAAGWGQEKQLLRMVGEGSVLFSDVPPHGRARDVAPSGFPHPVYRAGYALAVPIPWRVTA